MIFVSSSFESSLDLSSSEIEYQEIIENQEQLIELQETQLGYLGGIFFGITLALGLWIAYKFGCWIYSLIRL